MYIYAKCHNFFYELKQLWSYCKSLTLKSHVILEMSQSSYFEIQVILAEILFSQYVLVVGSSMVLQPTFKGLFLITLSRV